LAQQGEYEVKTDVGLKTMLEFVNAVTDPSYEVLDGNVQGLSALAEEFGCEELKKKCAQFLAESKTKGPPEEEITYFKMLQECEDEMEQIDRKVASLQSQFSAMTAELNDLPELSDSM
jgi:3-polyprenyl-4-hydroxybenzoate decarboxylase